MEIINTLISYFNNPDTFITAVLLVTLIVYNFFALAIAFQIFTYNRLMTQTTFAPVFRAVAVIHVALSFILLLVVIFAL